MDLKNSPCLNIPFVCLKKRQHLASSASGLWRCLGRILPNSELFCGISPSAADLWPSVTPVTFHWPNFNTMADLKQDVRAVANFLNVSKIKVHINSETKVCIVNNFGLCVDRNHNWLSAFYLSETWSKNWPKNHQSSINQWTRLANFAP